MTSGGLKVALVHDWLVSAGGGERVLKCLHDMFPEAPIYTLVYNKCNAPAWLGDCDVRTTYIQKWPGASTHHRYLLSFMPRAWEALDLTEFDLVISSCSSCCKGVLTRPDALHICYCHSPIRYVWDLYYDYTRDMGPIKRRYASGEISKVRMWDYLAAQRVDCFVSNSDFVGERIKKFYRRDSTTIHPGVRISDSTTMEPDDYYLVVSRFVRYKRIDIAIEACNMLGKHLIVIGSGGDEEAHLKQIAGSTVEFLSALDDEQIWQYYQRAKAFLFPGIEDFGITPVEAMGAGVPVLAFGRGGATETVVDGETGLYFHEQTPEGLASCMLQFEQKGVSLSRSEIREYSKQFSEERFKEQLGQFIVEKMIGKGF